MQLTLASVAALSVAVLAGGEARGAPLILRCDGIAIYVSPYEPEPTRVATQRYYWIDQQQFSRFQPGDIVWPGNFCTKKGAICSVDENTFNARWADGRSVWTAQINRKSGRARLARRPRLHWRLRAECRPSAVERAEQVLKGALARQREHARLSRRRR